MLRVEFAITSVATEALRGQLVSNAQLESRRRNQRCRSICESETSRMDHPTTSNRRSFDFAQDDRFGVDDRSDETRSGVYHRKGCG